MSDASPTALDLAVHYAPAGARAGVRALLDLDAALGAIVRTTREPVIGAMRLTWWFEALERLDGAPPPGQPILGGIAHDVLPRGVSGEMLAGMVDGWEVLLSPDVLTDEQLAEHAQARGGRLFGAMADVCGETERARAVLAGQGWALLDVANNVADAELATRARAMAATWADAAGRGRWSRAGRAIGALVLIAQAGRAPPPTLVARLLMLRLTGL